MSGTTLSISLPDSLRSYIDERVESGSYGNTSKFLRDLVRRDQLDQAKVRFRSLIEEGLTSGPGRLVSEQMVAEINAQVFGSAV